MGLQHLTEIEEHVAAGSVINCPHHPLKSLILTESNDVYTCEGSTPSLMACYYGELTSVKRIVECWGDVNLMACVIRPKDGQPIWMSSLCGIDVLMCGIDALMCGIDALRIYN